MEEKVEQQQQQQQVEKLVVRGKKAVAELVESDKSHQKYEKKLLFI